MVSFCCKSSCRIERSLVSMGQGSMGTCKTWEGIGCKNVVCHEFARGETLSGRGRKW